MDALSIIGNLASIIGALLSAYVLLDVKRLHDHFLLKARMPDFLKLLKQYVFTLSERLRKFDENTSEIETVLRQCESTLKNLISKVRGEVKQDTRNLLKRIRKRIKPTNKDEAWEIYQELQALIEALKHMQKDIKWRQ